MVNEIQKRRRPVKQPEAKEEPVIETPPVVVPSKFPGDVRIGMETDEDAKFITFDDGREYKVDKGVIVERIR